MLETNAFFLVRTQGVGVDLARARPGGRHLRPAAARLRRQLRHPPRRALFLVRGLRLQGARGDGRATASRATACGWSSSASRSRSSARSSTGCPRARSPRGPASSRWRRCAFRRARPTPASKGARGEVGCYLIADGAAKPYRMKWRGASFSNLAVLPHIIPGSQGRRRGGDHGLGRSGVRRGRPMSGRACRDRTAFVMGFIVLNAVIGIVTYVTLLERKFAARMQSRIGPYRVGPHGLLQPIADALKLHDEGRHRPAARRPAGLQPGADRLPRPVHADLRDDPVRARARRGRPQHRHPVLPRRVVDGDRRAVHGRLGLEQQVRAALGDARGQPDHLLRPAVHLRGAGARDAGRLAQAVRHRGRAAGPLVRLLSA